MRALPISVVITSLASLVQSILVNPSSPQCADLCGNTLSSTQGNEITCQDAAYASSTYGSTFQQCIACELSSTYQDPGTKDTDLQWALYNLRFALSWCLFAYENNTALPSTPCSTSFSCAPLKTGLEYDSLDSNSTEYGFCDPYINDASFITPCSNCLAETGITNYLSNFVTVLDAACIQQPVPGKTISITGNVFSSQRVAITTPSASPIGTYNPSSGGLTLGAKVGIIVGGLIAVLIVIGCSIIWRGRKLRRRALAKRTRESYEWYAAQGNARAGDMAEAGGHFFDSPESARPFANAWGHLGVSPQSPAPQKAYFSPYMSQYSSPVSAHDRLNHPYEWPRDKKVQPYMQEEEGERIEMTGLGESGLSGHSVSHTGPGKYPSHELTEDDARAGKAL